MIHPMINRLVAHFSCYEILPVDISDITGIITKDAAFQDVINFYPVDIDSGIIRGFIDCYEVEGTYGSTTDIADIYFSCDMSSHWLRLVKCKELIHLFDNGGSHSNTSPIVSKLISEIVTPPDIKSSSPATLSDRAALLWALTILFPSSCRDLLIEPYKQGSVSAIEIAKLADIPARYIPYLMSDDYAEWLSILDNEQNA